MHVASVSPQVRFGKEVSQSDFERVQAFLQQKHPQIADGFTSSKQCFLVEQRGKNPISWVRTLLQRKRYYKADHQAALQPETRYVACLEKLPSKKAADEAVKNEFWGAFQLEGDNPDARFAAFGQSRGISGLCAYANLFYRFSDTELLRIQAKDNDLEEFTLPDSAPDGPNA